MKVLVTGGCGFIGSHFVEYMLRTYPEVHVTNVDALTYAAHPESPRYLESIAPERYRFFRADIASDRMGEILSSQRVDALVNFAAETHVDRSILDPDAFVRTNVVGLQNLLRGARQFGNPRVVHVSTDEVYGSLPAGELPCTETKSLDPNSPYAASKAAADLIALANQRTYGQPVLITRCTNNYGPFQFPEKLLPLLIANALEDKAIPVYGDGRQVRDWIYVEDHCQGIDRVLRQGRVGEIYNISAAEERPNIEIIRQVLGLLGKPESLITHVGDRPAHDRRYALDSTKIRRELGWSPRHSLPVGLARTIEWYTSHSTWWKMLRNQNYQEYYQANYADKFKTTEQGAI